MAITCKVEANFSEYMTVERAIDTHLKTLDGQGEMIDM